MQIPSRKRPFMVWLLLTSALGIVSFAATPSEDLFRAVDAYWTADYDTAEKLLEGVDRSVLTQGEKLLLLRFLGATRLANQDGSGAEEAFVELVELDPTYEISTERFSPSVVEAFARARKSLSQRYYEEGVHSYTDGDFPAAIERFELCLTINPRHPMAGEYASLARERVALSEEAVPEAAAEPVELITNLQPASYATAILTTGATPYVDRDYVLTEVPEDLDGLTLLRTANDHKTDETHSVTFALGMAASVYVAHDRRITDKPGWLAPFYRTSLTLQVIELGNENEVTTYDLYRRELEAGRVELGANVGPKSKVKRKSMYFLLIGPVEPVT